MAIVRNEAVKEWTHKALVRRMASWLKMSRQYSVVFTELSTYACEIPDVIGWKNGAHSMLIECKTNRVDFLTDKKKWFRRDESRGVGNERYFAAPKGMLKPEDIPEGWGLLEVGDKQIREKVEPKPKEADKNQECIMLMSALRRVQISTAVFVRPEEDFSLTE